MTTRTLHDLLDFEFGEKGEELLRARLAAGENAHVVDPDNGETLLHVAARRFRPGAVQILLDAGVDVNAKTHGGKTAYAHAIRRGFAPVARLLRDSDCDTSLEDADAFAVAVTTGDLERAREIHAKNPGVVRSGNAEEDRLLADMAGRNESAPVAMLIELGADLQTPGLDDGTPLHQTAWFGQPQNARLLMAAGAPLDIFDRVHQSSPLGWATHGSRYSGGAAERVDRYVEVSRILLDAGASLCYPDDEGGDNFLRRMLHDAAPAVADLVREHAQSKGFRI